MRRIAVPVVLGALLVVGLSSCARSDPAAGPAATRGAPAASSSDPDSVTLDGQLEDGVAPGCTVLRADDGTAYVLTGILSHCNSGLTLQVLSMTQQG